MKQAAARPTPTPMPIAAPVVIPEWPVFVGPGVLVEDEEDPDVPVAVVFTVDVPVAVVVLGSLNVISICFPDYI